jgi:SAM-dependent methyltransferase
MSQAEPRPEPLRVPVTDVTVRSSIVGGQRKSREVINPALVVVQRAVRYISDPPPAPTIPSPSPVPEAQIASAPITDRVPEPAVAHFSSLAPAAESSARVDASHASPSYAQHQDPRYARVEVEPIDPLELDDDELEGGKLDEDEDDSELLDVSVPPPAPPEALRRSSSNPAAAPVRPSEPEARVTGLPRAEPSETTSGERPSEPLEELELEPDVRSFSSEPNRLPSPPPPPPPTRPSIPEPPDLSTLTRSARVQELRPTKPRTHAWWEVFFDDDYLRTVRSPTRQQIAKQCDFIEKRLGLKAGATLLDVACGLGQHVVELAARGYASVGVDLSLAMLSRASEEAQARGMRINFLHADMRDLSFESSFDAVTCLGTSLGYFDDETNRKVMERLLRALKPGGVLLLDVVNRDHVIRSQPNLIWFEGDGCVCMEESEFNFFTSRLHVKRTVILDNGRQLENEYSLRLYSLHELGQLLNASGFRVSEVSGRDALPGVFFGQESPNLMIVAERRSAGGDAAATT